MNSVDVVVTAEASDIDGILSCGPRRPKPSLPPPRPVSPRNHRSPRSSRRPDPPDPDPGVRGSFSNIHAIQSSEHQNRFPQVREQDARPQRPRIIRSQSARQTGSQAQGKQGGCGRSQGFCQGNQRGQGEKARSQDLGTADPLADRTSPRRKSASSPRPRPCPASARRSTPPPPRPPFRNRMRPPPKRLPPPVRKTARSSISSLRSRSRSWPPRWRFLPSRSSRI